MPKVLCSNCQALVRDRIVTDRQVEYSRKHWELHKVELSLKYKERYQLKKANKLLQQSLQETDTTIETLPTTEEKIILPVEKKIEKKN
jgi:hypothetical protein